MSDDSTLALIRSHITPAQQRALNDLSCGEFVRTREGWKTSAGRFVPLIVVAKLRKAGLALIDASKRKAVLSARGDLFVAKEIL